MQEAAIQASSDAGYSEAWYLSQGTQWVVRRSRLDLPRAIAFGVRLSISTWVADFRRVRSRREYEVRLEEDGTLVATAHTDWVYVDLSTAKPCRVPEAMVAAFLAGDEPVSLSRAPLVLPSEHRRARRRRRGVELRDLDGLGHVNNATALDSVDEAFFEWLADLGWSPQVMVSAGGHPRAVAHDVEYLAEARYREELETKIWAIGGDGPNVHTATETRRLSDDAVVARARTLWRWEANGDHAELSWPAELRDAILRG
jgi:acyl-CoA thioester hydrolase